MIYCYCIHLILRMNTVGDRSYMRRRNSNNSSNTRSRMRNSSIINKIAAAAAVVVVVVLLFALVSIVIVIFPVAVEEAVFVLGGTVRMVMAAGEGTITATRELLIIKLQ